MGNSLGYALAVEKLMGIEVSPYVQAVRVVMAELQRIASHCIAVGTYGMDIGAFTPFLYAFREREMILDLFEAACGARLTYSYVTIGGVTKHVVGVGETPHLNEQYYQVVANITKFAAGATTNFAINMKYLCATEFWYPYTNAFPRGGGTLDFDVNIYHGISYINVPADLSPPATNIYNFNKPYGTWPAATPATITNASQFASFWMPGSAYVVYGGTMNRTDAAFVEDIIVGDFKVGGILQGEMDL